MKIIVEGHGTFEINEEKLPQLLSFLTQARGVKVQESNTIHERTDDGFTGRKLLV